VALVEAPYPLEQEVVHPVLFEFAVEAEYRLIAF
jgi:hypothetical protein